MWFLVWVLWPVVREQASEFVVVPRGDHRLEGRVCSMSLCCWGVLVHGAEYGFPGLDEAYYGVSGVDVPSGDEVAVVCCVCCQGEDAWLYSVTV